MSKFVTAGMEEQKRNIDLMKSLSVYIDIDASSSSCQEERDVAGCNHKISR